LVWQHKWWNCTFWDYVLLFNVSRWLIITSFNIFSMEMVDIFFWLMVFFFFFFETLWITRFIERPHTENCYGARGSTADAARREFATHGRALARHIKGSMRKPLRPAVCARRTGWCDSFILSSHALQSRSQVSGIKFRARDDKK
jgi:hypothetical protein